MAERIGDWMQTWSGRVFWPMDPRPDEVHLPDIAHALAHQCRFAGHTVHFYSVAEHCCHIHDAAEPQDRGWALLHDASEAYLVDVPRPVKPYLAGYRAAEDRVMAAVVTAFGLPPVMPPSVKLLDERILADEAKQLMAPPPRAWGLRHPPLGVNLRCWSPFVARNEFLERAGAVLARLVAEQKSGVRA